MNKAAYTDSLIPRWLVVYGNSSSPMFEAFGPQHREGVRNADGLVVGSD
jgi:hypothetical protein